MRNRDAYWIKQPSAPVLKTVHGGDEELDRVSEKSHGFCLSRRNVLKIGKTVRSALKKLRTYVGSDRLTGTITKPVVYLKRDLTSL